MTEERFERAMEHFGSAVEKTAERAAGAPWLVLFLAAALALAVALGSRSVFARMEAESGHAR